MQALRQLEYAQPLELCQMPIPKSGPGLATIRILGANIISYIGDIYNGKRKYEYPTPLTTGMSAIGRVHETGQDSTSLQPDDLVIIDCMYRSRDDPTHVILSAIHEGASEGSRKLMSHWRDGTYAEYASIPLENCYRLNESVLLNSPEKNGLGYNLPDLLRVSHYLVPYGGFSAINLRPGETIIITPATGSFGSAAVHLALSLGARVIAMGRNTTKLAELSSTLVPQFPDGRLLTVPITNDLLTDIAALNSAAEPFLVDAYLDISPPQAQNSTHLKAAIMTLRPCARICLMGGQLGDVAIPHARIMHWSMTIQGKFMYERQDVRDCLRLMEVGMLKLPRGEPDAASGGSTSNGDGGDEKGKLYRGFALAEWKEAFEWAEQHTGLSGGAYFQIGK